jgi:hypothetical protein
VFALDEGQHSGAQFAQAIGIGDDGRAVANGRVTGRGNFVWAKLHETHATPALRRQPVEIAERGDVDSDGSRGIENGLTRQDFDRPSINCRRHARCTTFPKL